MLILLGVLAALALLHGLLAAAQPLLAARFGLCLPIGLPGAPELAPLGAVVLAGLAVGLLLAYRPSLADALSIRV